MPVRSTVLDGNGIVAQSVSQSVFDKEEQAPSHITVKEGMKKGGRYKVTKIATEPANRVYRVGRAQYYITNNAFEYHADSVKVIDTIWVPN